VFGLAKQEREDYSRTVVRFSLLQGDVMLYLRKVQKLKLKRRDFVPYARRSS